MPAEQRALAAIPGDRCAVGAVVGALRQTVEDAAAAA